MGLARWNDLVIGHYLIYNNDASESGEQEKRCPMSDCPFCNLIENEPEKIIMRYPHDVYTFEPLDPVAIGHTLVVPKFHVRDATVDPIVTAYTMKAAAEEARAVFGQCNIITSVGPDATQSVFHLHIHIVPRSKGDGLHLPWTGQELINTVV